MAEGIQPPAPPPNNQAQSVALLSQLPLGTIIGAPLKAAVEAQVAASLACYEFIQKVGFEDQTPARVQGQPTPQPVSRVREITFRIERNEGGVTRTTSITVPVLTIMPLPFLRIETMTVNFKASITAADDSSKSNTSSVTANLDLDASVGLPMWKVGVKGGISSKKDSTATNTSKYSVEQTMDISVHAVQDDMPSGLAKILSFMDQNSVARPSQP